MTEKKPMAKKPAAPSITLTPCKSSNVHSHGYDPITRTLAVQFKGKDGKPAGLYHYYDVAPGAYAGLQKGESVGRALGPIQSKHKFKKIGG
jgi:hypothetical protein